MSMSFWTKEKHSSYSSRANKCVSNKQVQLGKGNLISEIEKLIWFDNYNTDSRNVALMRIRVFPT